MIIRELGALPIEAVNHGGKAQKQVWLRQGEAANLTQVARASIPPGDVCAAHSHPDMWEMFVVEEGTGQMTVDGRPVPLNPGSCLMIAPGETHELANFSTRPLVLLVLGLVAPPTTTEA